MPNNNYITFSHLVPLWIVDDNRSLLPNYHQKHFDAWLDNEQLLTYEKMKCYKQKWQQDDIISIQCEANYDPIRVKVKNEAGVTVIDQLMQIAATVAGRTYFEDQIALDGLPEGYYTIYFYCGDPVETVLRTCELDIRTDHPETLLYTYSNSFNNNVLWETGIYFNFRCEAVIPPVEVLAKPTRTVYIDQPGSAKTVYGTSARQFKMYVGTQGGCPPWVPDKLEEIMDQTDWSADGKAFSVVDGSILTLKKSDRFGWGQWSCDVREALNRRTKRFDSGGLSDKKVVIDYVLEGKLFGPLTPHTANTNTYTINEIE